MANNNSTNECDIIGILTYHTGYNFGASLQAYALQFTVNKLLNEANKNGNCEIINFETYEFWLSREPYCIKPRRLKEYVKDFTRFIYRSQLKTREELFNSFTKNNLTLSDLYRTEQEVIDNSNKYSIIICGSDQIWNLSDKDSISPNLLFFLNFPKMQRRVSYAASFGNWIKYANERKNEFLPWLKEFDLISVREKSGLDYLNSLGIKCEQVLDPTILLDRDEYEKICAGRIINEPYILLFSWAGSKCTVDVVKKISKMLNKRIITIVPPPRTMFSGIVRKLDIGPSEFLSMIKYADFVVTDSFHGTVFSIIFEKAFYSVYSDEPDARIISLMNQLGLEELLIQSNEIDIGKAMNIDYGLVNKRKKNIIKKSIDFLKKALFGDKNDQI